MYEFEDIHKLLKKEYFDDYNPINHNLDISINKEKMPNLNSSYIPGHLPQPITNDDPEFILNFDEFICRRQIKIKENVLKEDIKETIYY